MSAETRDLLVLDRVAVLVDDDVGVLAVVDTAASETGSVGRVGEKYAELSARDAFTTTGIWPLWMSVNPRDWM